MFLSVKRMKFLGDKHSDMKMEHGIVVTVRKQFDILGPPRSLWVNNGISNNSGRRLSN